MAGGRTSADLFSALPAVDDAAPAAFDTLSNNHQITL
jgi:hypothetical protein